MQAFLLMKTTLKYFERAAINSNICINYIDKTARKYLHLLDLLNLDYRLSIIGLLV